MSRSSQKSWCVRLRPQGGMARTLCHELTAFQAKRMVKMLNDGWLADDVTAEALDLAERSPSHVAVAGNPSDSEHAGERCS